MLVPRTTPQKKRVLIVEDDADTAELMSYMLRPFYELVVARDGAEGMALAERFPPDLVITDVNMPELNGLAMARMLRGVQGLRVPIIFVSALTAPRDVIAGIAAGARHYLMKPVDMTDLKTRVGRALGV